MKQHLEGKKYIVVFDLEATCWEKEEHKASEMEIVELGAVKAEVETLNAIDEFNAFVRPIRYPVLSDFCKSLTSISQEDVGSADIFPKVFADFVNWVGEIDDVLLASWGNYDRMQLLQDCQYHKMDYPFGDTHLNLKQSFADQNNGRKYGMKRALRLIGLRLEGTHHRGIDDARNIWRIAKSLAES